MNAEQKRGYADGYADRDPKLNQSDDYYEGWDWGNGDRPSLEELIFDPRKEATDPLGY